MTSEMSEISQTRRSVEQIVFCVATIAVLGLAWRDSRGYPDLVRWFPSAVLIGAILLLVAKIVLELSRLRSAGRVAPTSAEHGRRDDPTSPPAGGEARSR